MSLLTSLKQLVTSHAAVYKQFAHRYDLVYFGHILEQDDDQRIVQGVTVSSQHHDEHYCVGTVHGYDVVLVQRTDTLRRPGARRAEHYTWQIMQFDLQGQHDHPHVFLDGKHHDEIFYQNLFIKFARLAKVEASVFADHDPLFHKRFSTYTPPDAIDDLPLFLTPERTATMAHHFGHLDFEWFQDRLIVYSVTKPPTEHLLEHMLRAGHWLARELDSTVRQKNASE